MSKLVYTDKSKIHGTGAFAGADLPVGLVIPVPFSWCDPNNPSSIDFEGGMRPKAPFCYLNHSTAPNCEAFGDDELLLLVLDPIKAGKELTIDYGDNYWETQ